MSRSPSDALPSKTVTDARLSELISYASDCSKPWLCNDVVWALTELQQRRSAAETSVPMACESCGTMDVATSTRCCPEHKAVPAQALIEKLWRLAYVEPVASALKTSPPLDPFTPKERKPDVSAFDQVSPPLPGPQPEPLMFTCYECDACNAFTPITESRCAGCKKPFPKTSAHPSDMAECHEHAVAFPAGGKCPACAAEKIEARPPCVFRDGCKYQPQCAELCQGPLPTP